MIVKLFYLRTSRILPGVFVKNSAVGPLASTKLAALQIFHLQKSITCSIKQYAEKLTKFITPLFNRCMQKTTKKT